MVHRGGPAILSCPLPDVSKLFLLSHSMSMNISSRKLLKVLLILVHSVVTSFEPHKNVQGATYLGIEQAVVLTPCLEMFFWGVFFTVLKSGHHSGTHAEVKSCACGGFQKHNYRSIAVTPGKK